MGVVEKTFHGGGGVWIFSGTTIVFLSNGIFRSQSGGRLKIDK